MCRASAQLFFQPCYNKVSHRLDLQCFNKKTSLLNNNPDSPSPSRQPSKSKNSAQKSRNIVHLIDNIITSTERGMWTIFFKDQSKCISSMKNYQPLEYVGIYILPARFIFVNIWLLWGKVYRNPWYIKFPLSKVICLLLGWFVISAHVAKKINILTAQHKQISNKQGICTCKCVGQVFQCRPHPVIITSSMFEERERKKIST